MALDPAVTAGFGIWNLERQEVQTGQSVAQSLRPTIVAISASFTGLGFDID